MNILRKRGALVFSVVFHAAALGAFALWKQPERRKLETVQISGGSAAAGAEDPGPEASLPQSIMQISPVLPRQKQRRPTELPISTPPPHIVSTARTVAIKLPPPTLEKPDKPPAAETFKQAAPSPAAAPAKLTAKTGGKAAGPARKNRALTSGRGQNGEGSGSGQGRGDGEGAGNVAASYLRRAVLDYPSSALRLKQEGVVRLRVHVGASGRADDVQVVSSSGFSALDAAAISCAKKSLYQPATSGGKAVAAWVEASFRFKA